jgi:serine/threonine-protein kinase
VEIERLFDGALELPSAERAGWLEAATPDDALRREVASMLAAHARVTGILDRAPVAGRDAALEARLREALADRYTLEREIGRGGMAVVFLAHERKHDRGVVLKVLRPDVAVLCGVRRFLSEVQLAARLSHPHILGLIDSGEVDGLLYYVMPHVGGETLRARLRRDGPLAVNQARVLLDDVAGALAYAHDLGVVHRDLKPENILCVGGHAFLMDFGVAKLRPSAAGERITAFGQPVGTPGYMAPEQEAGRDDVDQRADVYAWGLLACELLTGRAIPTPDLPAVRPDVPVALGTLVRDALAPEPDERPADGRALRERMASLGAPAGGNGRRWPWLAGAALLTAAVALALGLADRDPPGAPIPTPIAVAALRNETGDPALEAWGRLGGDWLTQGLQESGLAPVVPWLAALEASQRYEAERAAGGSVDAVSVLHAETGAGSVVAGAYYLVGDSLRFQLEVTNASTGVLLAAPQLVSVPRDSASAALPLLRARLLGALAVMFDEEVSRLPGLTERPPTYEAYRAFQRGLELHNAQRYADAAAELREAHRLDTTFVVPLVYAALSHWNTGDYATVDSLVRRTRRPGVILSEYHERLVDHLAATLAGDGEAALRSIRRAVDLAPGSRATYNAALVANALNRPAEALAWLESLDPDRGAMRGWSSYWTQLAHALHLLGRHERELEAVRAARARHPDRRVGLVLEVRALAALGRQAEIDALVEAASVLPTDTYWSQGAALVVAGEELAAHGHGAAAPAYLEAAERWFANQLAADPDHVWHRYWLGCVLYDAGRWEDAAPYFQSLAEEAPTRVRLEMRGWWAMIAARAGDAAEAARRLGPAPAYDRGEHTVFRARIAAVAGDHRRAIDLLAEALGYGVGGWPWIHASALQDLRPMANDPRYRRLVSPRNN